MKKLYSFIKLSLSILLLVISVNIEAQNNEYRNYSGQLLNPQTQNPIVGVTISTSTNISTAITGDDGKFSIIAPIGSILITDRPIMGLTPIMITEANSKPLVIETNNMTLDQSQSPYFQVISDSKKAWLPLESTIVDVNIAGIIANVSVKQIYTNKGEDVLEAIYIFPASTRAAVYSMKMTIGNRVIIAKVKEKNQAREEYEKAKSDGKTASLLEQQRPNVFQMNVANILPGDSIIIEMNYVEELYSDKGIYSFVYPTVVGPRYSTSSEKWIEQAKIQNLEKPKASFNITTNIFSATPLQFVKSSSHAIDVDYPTPYEAEITLNRNDEKIDVVSPETTSEQYWIGRDYIITYGLRGDKPQSGILTYKHNDENFFLLNIQPPKRITKEELPKREYVFIIDISGSMGGFPISVTKSLMRSLLKNLNPEDKFNVLLFAGGNNFLSEKSEFATKANINKAMKIIDSQRGNGSTRILPAMKNALAYSPGEDYARTFITVTDGYISVETQLYKLIRDNIGNANMFAFGIGSSVNRAVIEGMAYAGNGEPFIITNRTEAQVKGNEFLELIRNPVLTNIKVDYGKFETYDVNISKVPDLFSEKPVIIFGKYKGDETGKIKITGVRGSETNYSEQINIRKNKEKSTVALRYLWARNRIRYWDDFAQYFENINLQADTITKLGLKYNLLTNYTSFIAVDDVVRVQNSNSGNSYNNNSYNKKVNKTSNSSYNNYNVTNSQFSSIGSGGNEVEEVVVTALGISRNTKAIGYATTSVTQDRSALNSLQGKVAGVTISNASGVPGASQRIIVRGGSSVTNSTPLYIVDGIPVNLNENSVDFGNSSNDIDPDDIKTITIVKGAEAASLYGARGSNGVIIIETKEHNKRKKLNIKFNSSFAINEADILANLQTSFAQGRRFSGIPVWQSASENESFSWGPAISSLEYDNNGNLVTNGTGNGYPAKTFDKYEFLKKGFTNVNSLNIYGKYKTGEYDFAIRNHKEDGILPNSSIKNNSVNFSLEQNIGNDFIGKFFVSANTKTLNNLNSDHSYSNIYRNMLISSPSFNDSLFSSFDGGVTDNPHFSVNNNSLIHEYENYTFKFSPSYEIGKVTLLANIYDKMAFRNSKSIFAINSSYKPMGEIEALDESSNNLFSNFIINTNFNSENISLNVHAIGFYSKDEQTQLLSNAYGFTNNETISIDGGDNKTTLTKIFEKTRYGGNTYFSFDFKSFLFLTLSGELSSSNIQSKKTLLSESAVLSFIVSDMFNANIISYWKVYGTFSQSETDLPMFWSENLFSLQTFSIYNNILPKKEIFTASNINVEQTTNISLGTDMRLFNGKLNINAEYFIQNINNYYAPSVISNNYVNIINAGDFTKKGIELSVDGNIVRRRNLKIRSNLEFSKYNTNMSNIESSYTNGLAITEFPGFSVRMMEDMPAGVFYGTKYLRNDQGDIIIDANGLPEVDSKQGVIGNPEPDYIITLNSDIKIWRSITISFSLDAKKGGDIWDGTQNALNYYGVSQESADFRIENDNAYEIMTANGEFGVAEDAIVDGSWLRLNTLSLSYLFPRNISNKIKANQISFSIFTNNLFTITKTKGISPDSYFTENTFTHGVNYFNLPGTKSIGIKLNIKF